MKELKRQLDEAYANLIYLETYAMEKEDMQQAIIEYKAIEEKIKSIQEGTK